MQYPQKERVKNNRDEEKKPNGQRNTKKVMQNYKAKEEEWLELITTMKS
jgi:hypothetical protein